jgi:hypothetical protein
MDMIAYWGIIVHKNGEYISTERVAFFPTLRYHIPGGVRMERLEIKVRVSPELHGRLKAVSRRNARTLSGEARLAVERWVEQEERRLKLGPVESDGSEP